MKTNLRNRALAVLLLLAMLLSVFPMGAMAEETYTDVALNFKDASNGYVFNVETDADLSIYNNWKQLNLTVQLQTGASAAEAEAAELVDTAAYFCLDGSGKMYLYGAAEYRAVKLVIPAGTIVTPASDAGSDVKLRITEEIVLERLSSNWGTNAGWVVKENASEDETFMDIVLTHKDNSNGFTFTVDNTAGLSQYTDWKALNAVVQYQSGTTVEAAMAAELSPIQVSFNKDGDLLHMYGPSEGRGLKLVIPAGTILTPADDAGSDVKLRITNEVVLERAPSLYGQAHGWVQQVEQKEPIPVELDLYSTNKTDDWCFTPSVALESTGFYLTNAIIDGKQTAVMIECTSWDGGKLHIWGNTFAPGSAISSTAPVKDFVIPAGTVLQPTNGFAKQITLKADGQPYVLTQEFRVALYNSDWAQIEMHSANETYTDVKLLFHNASNGLIFNVQTDADLKTLYGTWKGLEVYLIRSFSKTSAAEAAAAKEYIKATFNVGDDGRMYLYGVGDTASMKLVIPAGSVIVPTDAALSDTKLHITNEIVLERESSYWMTASGWLQNVDMPAALDITISYNAVDASGNWSFTHTASDLVPGWYRMDAILDGTETAVLVEYPDPANWGDGMLYLYPHRMLPDLQATAMVPTTSFVIPEGAKLLPVTADSGSLKENAQPYTNTAECEVLSVDGVWPSNKIGSVAEYNMVLADALKLNFYVEVEESAVSDAEVQITVAGVTTSHKVSEAATDDKGRYIFTVDLAAAQMTEIVTVQLVNGTKAEEAKTYSVRQYADILLADEDYIEYHTLVKEMLNYGAAAQNYFSYNTTNPANTNITVTPAEIPTTAVAIDATENITGIRFYGATLVHESKTALRFYFTADGVEGITFTVGEQTYTAVPKNGMYYVEIPGINPQNLDDDVQLTVSNGAETQYITYAPVDYIIRMYNRADASDASKQLLQAMYGYHLAAKAVAEPSAEVSVPENGADPVL